MSQYLNESAVDLFITYKFVRLLTTKWDQTEAFDAGVIDAKGKLLVKGAQQTSAQKKVYTVFHKLVFNIKRILEKVPFGKSRIASYAAALFLLKEETGMAEEDILKVLEDLGHNTSIDLNEEFKELQEGQYILNHEGYKGTIVNLNSIVPAGNFAGVPIYKTQENIFISVNNIL
jgi:AAA+ ATPase superfamily predicted ATPase